MQDSLFDLKIKPKVAKAIIDHAKSLQRNFFDQKPSIGVPAFILGIVDSQIKSFSIELNDDLLERKSCKVIFPKNEFFAENDRSSLKKISCLEIEFSCEESITSINIIRPGDVCLFQVFLSTIWIKEKSVFKSIVRCYDPIEKITSISNYVPREQRFEQCSTNNKKSFYKKPTTTKYSNKTQPSDSDLFNW